MGITTHEKNHEAYVNILGHVCDNNDDDDVAIRTYTKILPQDDIKIILLWREEEGGIMI